MTDKQNSNITLIPCPECDTPIKVNMDKPIGSIFECVACGIQNELVEINPPTLAPLEEEK